MTPDEFQAITMLVSDVKQTVINLRDSNDEGHKEITKHLLSINGKARESHNAIFGVSADDPCLLRRMSKAEKSIRWLTDKWWWLLIIGTGLLGLGGFAGQVVEGFWKRGLPL